MLYQFNNDKPIYLQLATMLEDDIIKGTYKTDEQIVSTTELATALKINPATANKAINLLVDEKIVYKKRGLGMFVTSEAKGIIIEKRKKEFYKNYIVNLLGEAEKLNISIEEIITMMNMEEKKWKD